MAKYCPGDYTFTQTDPTVGLQSLSQAVPIRVVHDTDEQHQIYVLLVRSGLMCMAVTTGRIKT